MERGDRVFPHPVVIVTDASWITSRNSVDGWKSATSFSSDYWEPCEVLPYKQENVEPEIRQLMVDTDVKPVWHPSIKSRTGDVFFRRVFYLEAEPEEAKLEVVCGGRTNVYLNDRWVGETEEWPKITSFKVRKFLIRGKNLVAVQTFREPRAIAPPALFLALNIQTKFK